VLSRRGTVLVHQTASKLVRGACGERVSAPRTRTRRGRGPSRRGRRPPRRWRARPPGAAAVPRGRRGRA